jgi:hypothetical protein
VVRSALRSSREHSDIGSDAVILYGLSAVLPVWSLVDAAIRPTSAWHRSGHRKSVWVALQGVAVLLAFWGFLIVFFTVAAEVLALTYLLAIRRAQREA